MIIFINEVRHNGGGQTYVEAHKKLLIDSKIEYDFVEGSINSVIIRNIIKKRYTGAFINIYSPQKLWLILLLAIENVPIYFTVHGIWFLESASQRTAGAYTTILWLMFSQWIVLLLSKKIFVLSNYQRLQVSKMFKFVENKIVFTPGGVDLKSFRPLSNKNIIKMRRSLQLPQKSTIFLVVARLEKRKGIDVAITSFSNVVKTSPDCLLCVVFPIGEYSCIEELTKCFSLTKKLAIGDKVHFITGLNREIIPSFFAASDIFLMSSVELESFGLTTLEALASGCVPIGFNSGAFPELISQLDKNLIAESVTSTALTKRIKWFLRLSKNDIQKLKRKSRRVANSYSWEESSITLISCMKKTEKFLS